MATHIFIIGAGNVATHLSMALQSKGYNIDGVYSRTDASAFTLANRLHSYYTSDIEEIVKTSDIYLFAVNDNVLEELIAKVAKIVPNALFVHTAGSVDISVFAGKIDRYGVVYPLQTFSKNKNLNVNEIPFFVEGCDTQITDTLSQMCLSIGKSSAIVTSAERRQLHLAAVFACNFANHCYTLAAKQLHKTSLNFEVLLPLIEETTHKLQFLPPELAQTGPAVRHDDNVINHHISLLDDKTEKEIYRLMSESIYQTNRRLTNDKL